MNGIILHILKFVLGGAMIVGGLLLASFLISSTEMGQARAQEREPAKPLITAGTDSPNVVTSGMTKTINSSVQFMDSAVYAVSGGIHTAASTTTQVGKSVGHGVQVGAVTAVRGVGSVAVTAVKGAGTGLAFTGRAIGSGVIMAGRTAGNAALFVVRIPGNVVRFAANTTGVGALIRPSEFEEVPIIDPNSAELQTAISALPPAKKDDKPASKDNSGPQWPIHGRVTTEFGVDHWPFQRTHTGMDISNGHGAEVKPFRSGQVIETVYSNRGLGNHVVVDHGNGVTSVYAHLASIAVRKGQKVDLQTVLGTEGTTGVSTGNHLHFEIRVNGKAADPRKFVGGQP